MGAQPRPLRCVQGALKESAENGRLDVAPVLPDGLAQALHGAGTEFNRLVGPERVVPEQVSIKVSDFVGSEQTAVGHLLKEIGDGAVGQVGPPQVGAENVGQHAVGQQAGVLGVQAEHDAVEVAGQPLRVAVF